MSAIYFVARNTLRQTIRERLFLNIIVFGLGMLVLSMVVGKITFGYPDRVVRSIGLSGVTIAVDLMALLVSVTLIHSEIDRKTLFVVLTRPVRRWHYVLGRFLGLFSALVLVLIGFTVVFLLALQVANGTPRGSDFMALIAVLPEAAILGAFGLVLSSFSTPTLASGIGLGFWGAAATTDDLLRLSEKADGVTRAIAQATYYVLPSFARFNFREVAIYAQAPDWNLWIASLSYGVAYTIAFIALASAILSRREMI